MSKLKQHHAHTPVLDGRFILPHLKLEDGQVLNNHPIAYTLTGPAHAPLVVVLGGISAHRFACSESQNGTQAPWWPDICRPGGAIDTRAFRVLSVDYIGGFNDYHFPDQATVSTLDQSRVIAKLLAHLNTRSAHAVVGASYGGMVALKFAQTYPEHLQQLIAVSAADHALPSATAQRALQRDILRLGHQTGQWQEAITIARALAITTYRSEADFNGRFPIRPRKQQGEWVFPVHDYLRHHGRKFARRASALAYWRLSESLDTHRVIAANIVTPTTLIAVEQDQLVPASQALDLKRRLPETTALHVIQSAYGHDAFLKAPEKLGPIIRDCLCAIEEDAA